MEEEYFFNCPYCGERISILIDLSIDEQQYFEDCEICCRPISITYRVKNNTIDSFSSAQQEESS